MFLISRKLTQLISRKLIQLKRVFLNDVEKNFLKLNHPRRNLNKGNKIILLEMGEDIYFLVHFYFLLKKKMFQNKKIVGLWINPGNIKKPGIRGTIAFLFQCLILHLIKLKWKKIYKCLGVNEVIELNNNFKDNVFVRNTNFINKNCNLKNKEDVLSINFKGIKIGDLIYDHYLRFNNTVTFDIKNRYAIKRLLNFIETSNENLNNFYFKNKNNILYYISQKAFYTNGFAVRYFLNKNVKTLGGIEDNKYIKKFSKNDYRATTKCENLPIKFKFLKNKRRKISLSKKKLRDKFSGKISLELNYMRKSSYNKKKTFKIKKKFDAIIFLPDFSDAPHIYGKVVFNDFVDWIHETLRFLKLKNISIAIKEHPNSWVYNTIKFQENLKKKYSNLIWLNKNISNIAIFNNKPKFGISPFGTVLHELAYHKIIPIAVGSNPCMGYDFVFTPKNKKHYFELINKAIMNKLYLKKNFKEKIAECYYMFFLHNDDFLKNESRELNLKKYLPSVGMKSITILDKFNKGYFNK